MLTKQKNSYKNNIFLQIYALFPLLNLVYSDKHLQFNSQSCI